MKAECSIASFTFSSKPPTYKVVFGLVPFPPPATAFTSTRVLCMRDVDEVRSVCNLPANPQDYFLRLVQTLETVMIRVGVNLALHTLAFAFAPRFALRI